MAIAIAAASAAVGAVVSFLVAAMFFRRGGGARTRIAVGLDEVARIDPQALGVDLAIRVGTYAVDHVIILDATVTNRGPHDLLVADAANPANPSLRPRVQLPAGVRVLADPWNPTGSDADADVRLARYLDSEGNQSLRVHIHRLGVGASSTARLLCTSNDPSTRIDSTTVGFFQGFLPEIDIQSEGALRGARAMGE